MVYSGVRGSLGLGGNERWFLVHAQPKSERKAEMHLGAQGFQDAFTDDPKDYPSRAPAADRSGAAIPALSLSHSRSTT